MTLGIDEILARAAAPFERLGEHGFAPAQTPDAIVEARYAAWMKAAARGDPARFARLLQARGSSPERLRRTLVDVVVTEPRALPRWASAFRDLCVAWRELELAPSGPVPDGRDQFAPFAELGRLEILALSAENRVELGPAAIAGLQGWLRNRLATALMPLLRHELRLNVAMLGLGAWASTKQGPNPYSTARWLERFARYPGIARVIGQVWADWRDACAELLGRAATDMQLIAQTFLCGTHPGAITSISAGLGDPHDGGRSVAKLEFARGTVLYKPKDLRVTECFGTLVRDLAPLDADLDLTTPAIALRDGYAWEAMASRESCSDRLGFDRFYRRLGGWLRLFQLCAAVDMWLDNLIAVGDRPVFIDFETVLQPPPPAWVHARTLGGESKAGLSHPLTIGILPFHVPIGRGQASDIGCTALGSRHRTPFRFRFSDAKGTDDRGVDHDGYGYWESALHLPSYDGNLADPAEHFAALLDGYDTMAVVLEQPGATAALRRFATNVGGSPLRYIVLDTFSAYLMLDASCQPKRLVDGIAREIELERVWAFAAGVPVAIGESAIADLRRLDVPLFHVPANEQRILGSAGEASAAEDSTSALQALLDRIDAHPFRDRAAERDLVAAGLSLRTDRPQRILCSGPVAAADKADWRRIANEIAAQVVASARRTDTGGVLWRGRGFLPQLGCRALTVLAADLYDGTLGIALALADVAADAGNAAWSELAKAALLQCAVDHSRATASSSHASFNELGLVYALAHGGELLRDAELSDHAARLLASCGDASERLDAASARVALAAVRDHLADAQALAALLTRPQTDAALASLHRLPACADMAALANRLWVDLPPLHVNDPSVSKGSGAAIASVLLARKGAEQLLEPGILEWPEATRRVGALDRLRFALASGDLDGAEIEAREFVGWHRAVQTWFPDDWCPDHYNPSAAEGMMALSSALLRLARGGGGPLTTHFIP